MLPLIKADFKKLLVRPTYAFLLVSLAYMVVYDFYWTGFLANASDERNPLFIVQRAAGAPDTIIPLILISFIAIVLMAQHYRYGTIMYTLNASNSRTKILLSKILVVSIVALTLSVIVAILSPLMALAGMHIKSPVPPVGQVFYFRDYVLRTLFFGWGLSMAALLLNVLFRSFMATIAALFLIPLVVENLLGSFLQNDYVYLPFTALTSVFSHGLSKVDTNAVNPPLPAGQSIIVFVVYMLIGWVVAWRLFLRRDV